MTFQNIVYENLVRDAKRVFRKRGKDVFVNHLKDNMPLLSVYRGGVLAGIAMVIFPDQYKNQQAFRRNLKGYPLHNFNHANLTIVQGMMVRPNMYGQGVAKELLFKVSEISIEAKRGDLIAKVAMSNERSLRRFKTLGFEQFDKGYDTDKKYRVSYLTGDSLHVWERAINPKTGFFNNHRPAII